MNWLEDPSLGIVKSVRPSQVAMSKRVEEIAANGGIAFLEAATGVGKCHQAGQGILLHDGTVKKVEDICVGDRLVSPSGGYRTVLRTNTGVGELYEIAPVKGAKWRVNAEHILTVVFSDTSKVVDVSVSDYLKWPQNTKRLAKLFRTPADFVAKADVLLIDPYVLGALLGDGCFTDERVGVLFTSADKEGVTYLENSAPTLNCRLVPIQHNTGCTTYKFVNQSGHWNMLKSALRAYGLFGKYSGEKFIPLEYKVASVDVRKEVLAGLLDTDGSLSNNCFDYVSKSPQLADDVVFLARSLGLAAYVQSCYKYCQTGQGGIYYRVTISGHTDQIPCRISRKKAKPRQQVKDVLRTGFTVTKTNLVEPYYGFTLDGDGRYLLDDFTVTHNSFAYLTPVIEHAVNNGKRIVVSTAAKTLQDQLFSKDLPYLSEKVKKVSFAILKGKSNYLCELKTAQTIADGHEHITSLPIYGQFRAWADETSYGDLSTFPGDIPFEYLVNVEECVWKACSFSAECGYLAAKKAADKAQILVVNHHLLAYDLQTGGKKMLGDYDMLIVDEGHKLPEAIRSACESRFSLGTPKRLEKLLDKAGYKDAVGLREIQGVFGDLFHSLQSHQAGEWNAREHEVTLIKDAARWAEHLRKITVGDRTKLNEEESDRKDLRQASLTSFFDRFTKTCDALLDTDEEGNSPYLSVLEDSYFQGRPQRELTAKPVEVGPLLYPALKNIGKVVITSATLSVGGRFGYTFNEFGLAEAQVSVAEQFASNFNYTTGGILYIPPDAPLFDYTNRERDLDKQAIEIEGLVKASRGGGFILCASRSDMDHFYSYLARTLDPAETPIAKQGRSIDQDLVWFKQTKGATLIGMKSLWEGVDIQGLGLRLVVIPRVPFPNRSDALLAARKKLFIDRCLSTGMDQKKAELKAFGEFDVMIAGTDLAQGVGRLIRSETDKGVVAVLDGRMHLGAKKYTPVLRSCIPHAFTNNKVLVHKFLGMCADQHDKQAT